jgi:nucleoside-diphosphate-sugar epimerase
MKVLVTGGGGFVMSNAVRRLLESDPRASAVILDRDPYAGLAVEFFGPVSGRLVYAQADVLDRAALDRVAAEHDITHIVHAAAITPTSARERQDPRTVVEVNVMGTVNVLEWARRLPRLQRLVHVSSGSVYGEPLPASPEGPQPEDGPFNPPELYAVSKYAGELVARRYADLYGLDVRRVRFSGVFGPMERPTSARASMSVPYRMMRAYIERRPFRVTGPTLEAGGDWLNAEDIAEAIARLLRAPALSYDVYNIAYGEFTRVPELIAAFRQAAPDFESAIASPDEPADAAMNPAERRARWNAYAIERICADTGWQPRRLAEQVAGYVRWVLADPERRCPAIALA